MTSTLRLSVGRLEIDWGKNFHFADHSDLFQPCDLAPVPYYYIDEGDPYTEDAGTHERNLVTVTKDGLSKPFPQVIDRIALLGYTLDYARREFEYIARITRFDPKRFTFDQLARAIATVDFTSLSADYGGRRRRLWRTIS